MAKQKDTDSSGELDLAATIVIIVRGWWIVLIVVLICLAIAANRIYKFTPSYEAKMIIAPAASLGGALAGDSRLRSVSLQFGGLGGLGGGSADLFDQFSVILSSKSLAERLQNQSQALQYVFNDAWNVEKQVWKRPTGWMFEKKEELKKRLNMPEWEPPNVEFLAKFIKGNLKIEKVNKTDLYKLSIESSDPEFAAGFLKKIVYGADDILRERDYKFVSSNLSYIRNQLSNTSISEYRLVLIQLLAEQEQKMMFMQGPNPYAFQIVENISTPQTPSTPKAFRTIIVAIVAGIIIGIILAITFYVIRTSFRDRKIRIQRVQAASEPQQPLDEVSNSSEAEK